VIEWRVFCCCSRVASSSPEASTRRRGISDWGRFGGGGGKQRGWGRAWRRRRGRWWRGRLRRGVGGGSSPESDLILALMLSCEVRSDWISARSAASCALASAESKGCGGLVACSQLEAW